MAAVRWSFTLAALATLALACKPAYKPRQPEATVADDIDDIEAALSRNADDLEAAGLAVARGSASQDVAVGAEPPAPEPEPEPDVGGEVAVEDEDLEEGAVEADEEAPEPIVAEPMPAPDAAPAERSRDYRSSRETAFDRWLRRRRERKAAEARCQRICDLAEATCDLSERICELASRHQDELRYENACAAAEAQCSLAASACRECAL